MFSSEVLTEFYNLLLRNKHDFLVSSLQDDLSSRQMVSLCSLSNGSLTSTGVKGTLDGKGSSTIAAVFSYLAASIDRVTEITANSFFPRVHTKYSDNVKNMLYKSIGLGHSSAFASFIHFRVLSRTKKKSLVHSTK